MKSSCYFVFNHSGISELKILLDSVLRLTTDSERPWTGSVTSFFKSKSKSKIYYDRRSVGQSLLVSSIPLGLTARLLLLSDSWGVFWCGALSLTRERVCRLQSLLVLASAVILWSKSRGTRDHILLSQIRDSPNMDGQVAVFISPRNSVAQSQNYVTTDGQSASLSWCQAPIWGLRLDFHCCQTVVGLLMWGALS
jgi:hypothetical protein